MPSVPLGLKQAKQLLAGNLCGVLADVLGEQPHRLPRSFRLSSAAKTPSRNMDKNCLRVTMKKSQLLGVLLVVCGAVSQSNLAHARDIYLMSWKGTRYVTNPAGKVVAQHYSEKDIIAKCASDNGISDVRSLAYVYVANELNTEVVFAATGQTVCEIFQLENSFTAVPSVDGNETVRQAFVFNEAHGQALGSAFGVEHLKRDSNGDLTSYSYKGTFQFAVPEDGAVYSGTFTTGKRLKDTASQ